MPFKLKAHNWKLYLAFECDVYTLILSFKIALQLQSLISYVKRTHAYNQHTISSKQIHSEIAFDYLDNTFKFIIHICTIIILFPHCDTYILLIRYQLCCLLFFVLFILFFFVIKSTAVLPIFLYSYHPYITHGICRCQGLYCMMHNILIPFMS